MSFHFDSQTDNQEIKKDRKAYLITKLGVLIVVWSLLVLTVGAILGNVNASAMTINDEYFNVDHFYVSKVTGTQQYLVLNSGTSTWNKTSGSDAMAYAPCSLKVDKGNYLIYAQDYALHVDENAVNYILSKMVSNDHVSVIGSNEDGVYFWTDGTIPFTSLLTNSFYSINIVQINDSDNAIPSGTISEDPIISYDQGYAVAHDEYESLVNALQSRVNELESGEAFRNGFEVGVESGNIVNNTILRTLNVTADMIRQIMTFKVFGISIFSIMLTISIFGVVMALIKVVK